MGIFSFLGKEFNFKFNSSKNGYVLTKYNGKKDVVEIPSTYNGLPVEEIEGKAFRNNKKISSVELPNTITRIGGNAFVGCTGLKKVNYLGVIDEWAEIKFEDVYSNPITYATKMYFNGGLLKTVNLQTAKKISNYAFNWCDSITNVVIGNSVESIGDWAFAYCTSLTNLTISKSVKSIGADVLLGCKNCIVTYEGEKEDYLCVERKKDYYGNTFDRSIDIVYAKPLDEKTNDDDVIIEGDFDTKTSILNDAHSGGNLSNKFTFKLNPYNSNEYTIEKYVGGVNENYLLIPSEYENLPITQIGENAFKDLNTVKYIEIANTIKYIGKNAFMRCGSLNYVIIPEGVTRIYDLAFNTCNKLSSIVLPHSLIQLGNWAFYNCKSLKKIFYQGTQSEFEAIKTGQTTWGSGGKTTYHTVSESKIRSDTGASTVVYYYSETPLNGNYWHYVNGEPKIWKIK